ncbi:hypothetical protein ACPWT1_01090 [Ramlibacter sp. MMS24-I3-19]|uniref:hypothetical protein n=1 Tax=Ramlibacter sp. MMS24-I3-19 TaxID=3416606 RepID=UPI003D0839FF
MNLLAGQIRLESGLGALAETMPADLELRVDVERLVGPVNGYYLACYTIDSDAGCHGYAKVYTVRPTCVWGSRTAVAKYSAGPFATAEAAIEGVVEKCRRELAAQSSKANRLYRYLLRLI